jgi:tRNA U38,U39,U40 pseudouridine synthase TruA
MTPDELNTALKMEIINYKEINEITNDLKRLLMELVWLVSYERFEFLSENLRTMCEAKAYEYVCKHSIHYNPEKSDNAMLYVKTIIRCSFAITIKKIHKNHDI